MKTDLPLPRWCYSPWVTGPVGAFLGHLLAWITHVDGFPRVHWWQIANFSFYALMAVVLSGPIKSFLTRSQLMRGRWTTVAAYVIEWSVLLAALRSLGIAGSEWLGSSTRPLHWFWADFFHEALRGVLVILGLIGLLVYGLIALSEEKPSEA